MTFMRSFLRSCLGQTLGIVLGTGLVGGDALAWGGYTDTSDATHTEQFNFTGPNPELIDTNENYYDGDFGDFDGDGLADRALGSRYGLLHNTGGAAFATFKGRTGFKLRGMSGASGWGEDMFQWLDVDNDGDLDVLSGGNFEPLVVQENREGRFLTKWSRTDPGTSTIHATLTDIERDGDVDFLLTDGIGFAKNIGLWVNGGNGVYTREDGTRGLGGLNGEGLEGSLSGDIDGDGDFDLIINTSRDRQAGTEKRFYVCKNDGTGHFTVATLSFATPVTAAGAGGTSVFYQSMNLGDIDDDGDLDFVMATNAAHIGKHPDIAHVVFLNDGHGGFTEQSDLYFDTGGFDVRTLFPTKMVANSGKLADLDYDGDLDFVTFSEPTNLVSIFLNDGAGLLTYDVAHSLAVPPNASTGFKGEDLDVSDLDGDGVADLWVGVGGGRARTLINTYVAPSGTRANVPRNVRVSSATAAGVTLAWEAPAFASTARSYRVYRATAAGLEDHDRRLLKHIGVSKHGDETFFVPITRHTTTAYLNDPDVELVGATETVRFIDRTAQPGVYYFYAVSHIGTENNESAQSAEVAAVVPRTAGADVAPPQIVIQSPTQQSWQPYARIVIHLGDDSSGVDASSLIVSSNKPVGTLAAGTNLVSLAERNDGSAFIAALVPPLMLPAGGAATLTVSVDDLAGNHATQSVTFTVGTAPTTPPTASLAASATSGAAPLAITFDGSASTDDDRLLRWEWSFGDGATALGRKAAHRYVAGGTYTARLLVRDNQGGVATTTQTITVTGGTAQCTTGEQRSCYTGPAGTAGVGACVAGVSVCLAGQFGPCSAEITPSVEICDGLDNDCSGAADEPWPELGAACTAGVGACQSAGQWACSAGVVACSAPQITAQAEVCDGQNDENCNGAVDDGCACSAGETRTCYGGPLGTAGVGVCARGTQSCAAGTWSACTAQVLPGVEACGDGLDNDCDAKTDGADEAECGETPVAATPDLQDGTVLQAGCQAARSGDAWTVVVMAFAALLRRRRVSAPTRL